MSGPGHAATAVALVGNTTVVDAGVVVVDSEGVAKDVVL